MAWQWQSAPEVRPEWVRESKSEPERAREGVANKYRAHREGDWLTNWKYGTFCRKSVVNMNICCEPKKLKEKIDPVVYPALN